MAGLTKTVTRRQEVAVSICGDLHNITLSRYWRLGHSAVMCSADYAVAFRNLAHRALCAAAMRLLALADICRRGRTIGLFPALRLRPRPRPRLFRLANALRAASMRSNSFSNRLRSDCNSFTARLNLAIRSPMLPRLIVQHRWRRHLPIRLLPDQHDKTTKTTKHHGTLN